ncbi:hypothetical protein SAMN05421505_102136 [Sinosporangium album]|uniref:Uncharacterized protein n=1 Tax=Sinosporangium album TaxID=504805 RepID=A0A1G7S1T5_9ACTN|nr:hypothetical protein [Sinosporangium album]SDG16995.1 hypothetical protein SAMN05421505_102136 [Sinosporangium album]
MADPRAVAAAVKGPVGILGGGFMVSREAKVFTERTGLPGWTAYFRGRCGVLGEVDADVVTASTVFFPAEYVRDNWEAGRGLPVDEAVAAFADACQEWGRRRFGGFAGTARLAALTELVVDNADVIGAPLFAGWRAVPLAADAPARLSQLLHTLRELRGGLHAVAVLGQGIHPLQAALAADHDTPMGRREGEAQARFSAWPEPFPDITPEVIELRAKAEEITDDLIAPAFEILDEGEAGELIGLLEQALAP